MTDTRTAEEMKAVTEALEKRTPIEKATQKLVLSGKSNAMNGCGVGLRPCRGIAVAQVGCCCDMLHYGVNACEKHIATAVKTVNGMGCEVEVHRIYTAGEDQGLFEGRRDKSRQIAAHQKFLEDMLKRLEEDGKLPTTDDYPDGTDHLKAVVRYAYADNLRDAIERFRNSLTKG